MTEDELDVPSAPTEDLSSGFLRPGQILGERYRIGEQLGRGGMGEVWRAFDLKLRVEVALKALREDFFRDEKRRDLLRQEVRAAREVVSPNVCRIFDLIEADGRELVSMEYVDGGTLLDVLRERGPLDLKEAQDIASQFLAGLEAIHKAGLIHRDVKPENIMVTRAGRVVLMDFGLARQQDSGAGTVAGTPAYMAPEQAAGLTVDARADVYSAGVVLAEMVSPEGIRDLTSRQSVWEGIRHEPARVPESPWAPVLKKAVAKQPDQRYKSAHTLTRALEDVTLRVDGAEDLKPYPGLASFTAEDAEYFFGREVEIEALWAKLDRPHLLAIVGPSGAGKTSFIKAGVMPAAPAGWACVVCTPGTAATSSLARLMAREMAGDADVFELLLAFDDPDVAIDVVSRWRRKHGQALLVVDQFEELFTLNTTEEQARFSTLLGRLVIEADVFVVLSLRDDFLMRCRDLPSLQPIFSDLTAIPSLAGSALRRALVQPATRCGYRFEDDELVDEMLAEVEGERGALPMLAFAAARVWEKRDRETGVLTRKAFHKIGGVGGALAKHAEATLQAIGAERLNIVRELFRNLVTSEGTRAVREWDELLSVFGSQHEAEAVLRALIDARLLTSYEVQEEAQQPTRRVEIVHESLLANWPRLVRWQTQDAEGAQLRDELRQAARAWDEHGRADDRLWTGSAFREFSLWRERYPGGLSETEESFAAAMTRLAGRRRRLRRAVVAAILLVAAAVAAVTTALWRRSVLHQRQAEAQKLIALGKNRLVDHPTASFAYASRSLELADSDEARTLALEALWEGPPAFIVNDEGTSGMNFSPDGSWLVQGQRFTGGHTQISRKGIQRFVDSELSYPPIFGRAAELYLVVENDTVVLRSVREEKVLASMKPEFEVPLSSFAASAVVQAGERTRAVFALVHDGQVGVHALAPDSGHEVLGTFSLRPTEGGAAGVCVPRYTGDWVGVIEGNDVSVVGIGDHELTERRFLGRHEGQLLPWCDPDHRGGFLVTVTLRGEIKVWDATGRQAPTVVDDMDGFASTWLSSDGSYFYGVDSWPLTEPLADAWVWSIDGITLRLQRRLEGLREKHSLAFDPIGMHIAMRGPEPATRLWSLGAPAAAEPMLLRRGSGIQARQPEFSPDGNWIATGDGSGLTLWPLARPYPAVIPLNLTESAGNFLRFSSDGSYLALAAKVEALMIPLGQPIPAASRKLFGVEGALSLFHLYLSPDDRHYVVYDGMGRKWFGDIDGGETAPLPEEHRGRFCDFSPDGRLLACMKPGQSPAGGVQVWDLANEREVASLQLDDAGFGIRLSYCNDGRVLIGTTKGVVAWDVSTGDHEVLVETRFWPDFIATEDGKRLLVTELNEDDILGETGAFPMFHDLESGKAIPLTSYGRSLWCARFLDNEGTMVAIGGRDGIIRVGPADDSEPHLLLGHEGTVLDLAVDPLGRWIASAGQDDTIRLWPMPDLSQPPIHTLPREQLIAKLESLTNIRLVHDPDSSTGWTLTHEPFQGWETAPTW